MSVASAARTAAAGDLADRLFAAGSALLAQGRAAEALPFLERVAGLPGGPPSAVILMARALTEMGRAKEAELALDAHLGAESQDGPALVERARARRALGERVAALDDAAAAVMANPRDAEARQMLAMCLSDVGRHDEAILLFHELLVEAPEDLSRILWLGTAFSRAHRHEAAEELFSLCAARQPDARGVATLRAQNFLDQGEAERAAEIARAAIARVGPEPTLCRVLGQALHRLGDRAGAAAAFRDAARLAPEDPYLQHMAAELSGEEGVGRASDAYIRNLFDDYAERFEGSLFALGYRVPGLILRLLEQLDPSLKAGAPLSGDVLDLGCGTGLIGVVLHDVLGGSLLGVDLSERMVEHARRKGIYSELHVAEIGAFLAAERRCFRLIIAADVFCYFGALDQVLAAARSRLEPGGRLLFSVERKDGDGGWELGGSARYRHSAAYVCQSLAGASLRPLVLREEDLRREGGQPVRGLLVAAEPA